MFCKCSINPIANPNPVYSRSKILITGVRSGIGLIDHWIEDCSGLLYRQPVDMEQITETMTERLLDIMKIFEAKLMAKLDTYQE
jgi:hypothetical protein